MSIVIGPTKRTADQNDTIAGKTAVMGKDDFLKMLVTQLKNQDPMNPLEGTEYATQLAQFSSVEQLMQISKSLDTQAAAMATSQAFQAQTASTALGAAIVGHDVLIAGNSVTMETGTTSKVSAEFGALAAKATVRVYDAKGREVHSQQFVNLSKGKQELTLDTKDLPSGDYTFKVEAFDSNNVTVKVGTYTQGTVNGMAFSDNDLQLRVNGILMPMKNILEVLPIAQRAAATTTIPEQTTP